MRTSAAPRERNASKAAAGHAEAAGLKLVSSDLFGQCYVRTLAEWRKRFRQSSAKVQALGFDERFRRLWDYYLAYCEAGFNAGTIDVGLFVFEPDGNEPRLTEESKGWKLRRRRSL